MGRKVGWSKLESPLLVKASSYCSYKFCRNLSLVLDKLKRDLKIPQALHSNAFLEVENEIHELMQRNASGVGQKPETIRTMTR
jgi:hypothetical protein